MYEKIAWNIFLNTGDIESFLEYKRLICLGIGADEIQKKQDGSLDDSITQGINKNAEQNINEKIDSNKEIDIGELLNEINKGQWDSDKGSNV
ncbi:MAG: hypothetical protein RSE00_02210 [Clostridia bacterium]